MLVPETVPGLWKQRLRWAQGGQEVVIRDLKQGLKSFNPAMYFLIFEQIFSLIWVYSVVLILILKIINANLLDYYFLNYKFSLLILSALILTFLNAVQFTIALIADSKYEKINVFTIVYLSWYSAVYWIINASVAILAFPKAVRRKKGEFATWTSPDRGSN